MNLAVNLLDARSLLGSFGTVGIALVLFAETGLLIGLFLPGDPLAGRRRLAHPDPARIRPPAPHAVPLTSRFANL